MLQADAYAGFEQIYEVGNIREAACWAHVRRKFYDLQVAHKSPVAEEALRRIGERQRSADENPKNVARYATSAAGRCWNH